MALTLELSIAGSAAETGHYFSWAPRPAQARVVDADGKPVAGCEVHGASERWGWQDIASAEFPIEDMQAGERRKVLAFHRDRGLAGGVIVKHGDPQPVEIKLAPTGTLTGRLVDTDGPTIPTFEFSPPTFPWTKTAASTSAASSPAGPTRPMPPPIANSMAKP